MESRYQKSEAYLKRALKTVPLGTQTFSKSRTQFPMGVSPYFITKGKGARVWDLDDNEYLDFVNGLLSVSLGYGDTDIDQAVKAQIADGVSFSLPHPIEAEVAEKIVGLLPCAEMVRFGKNGSDATSGAIRIARAHTKRDHIAICGYHGWHDWYIGVTSRNLGVPKAVQDLSHTFRYNDIDSLQKIFDDYPDQVATVIMEPMALEHPEDGFLEKVKELAHKNGALLIFDEIITAFRMAKGGCQELFGVTPDLAAIGKGMANGYPISAVVGRADVMQLMEEVFYSFTFGGEAVSLTAASVFLDKVKRGEVVEPIHKTGELIISGTNELIQSAGLTDTITVKGHPAWSGLILQKSGEFTAEELKTYFLQEAFRSGILTLGTHNISVAHTEADVKELLSFYAKFFPQLKSQIQDKSLRKNLNAGVLKPLFSVRAN